MSGLTVEGEQYLAQQYDQYGFLGVTEINDIEFAWRRLTRGEYKALVELDLSSADSEEWICAHCVVYPQGFDFSNCAAGIPTTLSREILEGSFFTMSPVPTKDSPGYKLLQAFRQEMEMFENQVDCIIAEAFPRFSIEEIGNWTVDKTMYYLSRAEWTLHQLRGLPLMEVQPQSQPRSNRSDVPPTHGTRVVK